MSKEALGSQHAQPERAGAEETAAPAERGGVLAGLARATPEQRAASLARMAGGTGQFSIARAVLARREDTEFEAKEIMREKEALEASGVKIDLDSASEDEKLEEIRRLQGEGKQAGAARVWRSFGKRMPEVALANRELFESALEADKSLVKGYEWQGVRDKFKAAVESKVLMNLFENRMYVTGEMEKLGVGGDSAGKPDEKADKEVRNLQLEAEAVQKAHSGMQKALSIPVGYDWDVQDLPGRQTKSTKEIAYFSPATKPMLPGDGPSFKSYDEVKKEYDKLDLAVQVALAQSPALFALVGETGTHATRADKAGEVAKLSPAEARAKLKPALEGLIAKIEEASQLVGGDMDYRDFLPVHEQLMKSPEWSGKTEKAVIAADIEGHESSKLLQSLGLGAISAIGFLVATFATGGMTIFLGALAGVAASGAQAGISWEDYLDKAKAYEARTGNPQLDIMSKESVDSAFFQAMLDTALALIDAWSGIGEISKIGSPALKLIHAGEAGLKASAETALKEALAGGEAAAKAAAVERAVAELGTDGAARAAGKTPDELARLLPEGSETAKRLAAAAEAAKAGKAGTEDLIGKLKELTKLAPDEAARVVTESLDKLGYIGTVEQAGGWKAFTKALGEGHPAVTKLEAWRSALVAEAGDYVTSAAKGEASAVRTGTEKGTSDVDISTFGKDAAQNVERVKEFMARRLNTTRDKLEFLLDADAAVNPARMHLQDVTKGLSEAAHKAILDESAKHQEKLIFARRWHDAVQAGDEELMKQLEELASTAGVGDIPKGWKPMDPQAIAGLEKSMDEWSQQLAKLEADGADAALKKPLIDKIGRAQAEVLANNPNMYMDAGNIKSLVTRRPIDKDKIEAALGALDPESVARLGRTFPQERYLKILGEGSHLDHAFAAIKKGASPQSVADAMKSFAKHGQRVVETIGSDIAHGLDAAGFDAMAKTFEEIVAKAKTPQLAIEAAEDMAKLQAQAAAQAGKLQTAMTNATKALREQASLGAALTAEEAAGIGAWARAEGAARAASEALKTDLLGIHAALKAGKVVNDAGQLVDADPSEQQSKMPEGEPAPVSTP